MLGRGKDSVRESQRPIETDKLTNMQTDRQTDRRTERQFWDQRKAEVASHQILCSARQRKGQCRREPDREGQTNRQTH